MRNGKSKRNNEKGKREEKEKKKNRSTPPKYNVTDTRGKKERERERGSFGWKQTVEAGEGDDSTKADHVGGTRTVLSVPRRWEYVQE